MRGMRGTRESAERFHQLRFSYAVLSHSRIPTYGNAKQFEESINALIDFSYQLPSKTGDLIGHLTYGKLLTVLRLCRVIRRNVRWVLSRHFGLITHKSCVLNRTQYGSGSITNLDGQVKVSYFS